MKSRHLTIVLLIFTLISYPIFSLLSKSASKTQKSAPHQTKSLVQKPAQHDKYDETLYNWTKTMSEAFHLVKTKYYVKDLDPKEAMIKAINAFVSLDPHSVLLDPKTYKEIIQSTSGEFYGTGIIIATKNPDDEFLVIIDVVPDGPADKAGIRGGDKIIEIEGNVLRGMTTDEATAKLKGERHSIVNLKIVRDNFPETLTFSIKRDVIKEQSSMCYYFKDYDVYYLHLNIFSQNAFNQLSSLLKKTQKKKCRGIILDLRNNSGGLLNSAVDIASLFVKKNSLVVTTKDRNNKVTEAYHTQKDPIATNGTPIFVLFNNWTASAAEILAGCLKVHSEKEAQQIGNKKQTDLLVFLVGTKTFGKGSVQEVIPVSNDCAIKLTVALYFLPNDITVQGTGIEPDIELEQKFPPTEQMKWVNKFYGRESALKNSIKTSKEAEEKNKKIEKHEKKVEKPWKERRKEIMSSDSQIKDTLTCINILALNPDAWKNRNDAIKLLKNSFVNNQELNFEEING